MLALSPTNVGLRTTTPMMASTIGDIDFESKPWTTGEISTRAGMMELAKAQNPIVGFWDPLDIVNDEVKPETIGWFRHAEIKQCAPRRPRALGFVVALLTLREHLSRGARGATP